MTSRFGDTGGENYGSTTYRSDAMGVKGESSNVLEWTSDAQEMLEKMFEGTEANGEGQYARDCADKKGSVPGKGPACAKLEEVAQADLTECFYVETLYCIDQYRQGVFDSTSRFIAIYVHMSELRRDYDSGNRWGNDDSGNFYSKVQSLEPERENYDNLTEAFNDCLDIIKDRCECHQCVTGSFSEDEDDDDGDDGGEDDDVDTDDLGLTPNYETLETSSTFNVIPRVWGRYVVGGNIIWIGNQRNVLDSITYETSTGRTVSEQYKNYIDMDIGLCVGEADGIIRVWLDDLLIYNDLLVLEALGEATDDFQGEMNTPNPFDLSSTALDAPRIRFFGGSEAQHVYEEAANQEGFGRVPAYRGLCYMRLENVNLNLFGGTFPKLRIEIATLTEADNRFIDSGAETIDEEYMAIEPRTGQLFAVSGGNLTIFNWDTLEKGWTVPFDAATDKLAVLPSGYPMQFRPLLTYYEEAVVYDQAFAFREAAYDENATGDPVAKSPHNNKPMLTTTSVYVVSESKGRDRVVYTTEADYIRFIDYDYTDEILTPYNNIENPRVYTGTGSVVENLLYHDATGTYYIQFRVNTTSATYLDICKYHVASSEGVYVDFLTSAELELTSILAANIWGGETTGIKIIQAVNIARDNSILLFIRQETSGTYRIVKLDPTDMSIVWSTVCPYEFDSWGTLGATVASRSISNDLYFLAVDGKVLDLDLTTGELYLEGNLSDYGWPAYATNGAQYFDGRTASLTYVTTAGKIARIFFDRVNPLRASLATIASDIANGSSLTANIIDATALNDVTVAGYAVTDAVSVKTFFSEVIDFYQLAVIDDGDKISLAPKGDLSAATVLDPALDIIIDTTARSSLSQGTLPDSIRVSFVTIDNTGLVQNVQELSVRGDDEVYLQAPKTVEFELKVNEDPDIMRQYSEQALIASRSEQTTFGAALMPRRLALTTHDPITVDGATYRITSSFISPDNRTDILGTKFNLEDFSAQVAISSASLYNEVAINRVTQAGMYRPVVLFTNALSNDAALRSASGRQIAYALMEAGTADITATRVYLRISEHDGYVPDRLGAEYADYHFTVPTSNLYVSPQITKAAHFGLLKAAPLTASFRQTPWTSSEDDTLEVEFARDDTMTLIQALTDHGYPGYSVLESETENLLVVGQEYIKFGSYEVIDTNKVRFSSLIRGYLGTEPYMYHEQDERVYLYTSDTFKEISIEPSYTKRRARAKVFTSVPAPAGTSHQAFYPVSDAGSARPWPPTAVKVHAKDGDGTQLVVSVRRQHPLFFELLADGGPIIDIWGSKEYYLYTAYYDDVQSGDDATEFNFNGDAKHFNLAGWQIQTVEDDEDPFVDHVIEFPSQTISQLPQYVYVAHIARDENGGAVVGHPTRVRVAVGYDDTYPST